MAAIPLEMGSLYRNERKKKTEKKCINGGQDEPTSKRHSARKNGITFDKTIKK